MTRSAIIVTFLLLATPYPLLADSHLRLGPVPGVTDSWQALGTEAHLPLGSSPQLELNWGRNLSDLNADGRVDLCDYATFALCFSVPGSRRPDSCSLPDYIAADLDQDGDVDLDDDALFRRAMQEDAAFSVRHVRWTGATELRRTATSSVAQAKADQVGSTLVRAEATLLDPATTREITVTRQVTLHVLDLPPEQLRPWQAAARQPTHTPATPGPRNDYTAEMKVYAYSEDQENLDCLEPGDTVHFQVGLSLIDDGTNEGLASAVYDVWCDQSVAAQYQLAQLVEADSGWSDHPLAPALSTVSDPMYVNSSTAYPGYNGGWGFDNAGLPSGGNVTRVPGAITAAGILVPLSWTADVNPARPGLQPYARLGVGHGTYTFPQDDPYAGGMTGGFGQDLSNKSSITPGDGTWYFQHSTIDTSDWAPQRYIFKIQPDVVSLFDPAFDYTQDIEGGFRDSVPLHEVNSPTFTFTVNGDCNGNTVIDCHDIAQGTSQDCQPNGIPDECDTEDETSLDCNSNDVPDECDIAGSTSEDCNSNGVPDECDISGQTSEDCNSNNIPDECDVDAGTAEDCNDNYVPDECEPDEDCNGNGVQDICDIAAGTAEDCNGNDVPDSCDLADGTSNDVDGNSIPDECDGVIYVDADAPCDPCDGQTWSTAYTDLQDALAHALDHVQNTGIVIQIWIAEGTYKPTSGTDRTATFQLHNRVSVYGGYAGYGQPDPDQQDASLHATTLSGEIGQPGTSDNTYHVVTASGTDSSALLDGVTITAGYADGTAPLQGNGGGMLIDMGSPTLANCTFTYNNSAWAGGGLYNREGGNITLTDCTFTHNATTQSSGAGAAMYFSGDDLTLTRCTFSDNGAVEGDSSTWRGGAIRICADSMKLQTCLFDSNAARQEGGAICASLTGSTYGPSEMVDCTFVHNTVKVEGGALFLTAGGHAVLSNCTFIDNDACADPEDPGWGGAIYTSADKPLDLVDCTFAANKARYGGAVSIGWGIAVDWPSPPPPRQGPGKQKLVRCTFTGNTATVAGGAILAGELSSQVTMISCVVAGNTADAHGGGLYLQSTTPEVFNSLVAGNQTTYLGAGIFSELSRGPTIVNSTIVGNHSGPGGLGAGLYVWHVHDEGTPIANCILWGNSAGDDPDQIRYRWLPIPTAVDFNCIQGWNPGDGGGPHNTAADPSFPTPQTGTWTAHGSYSESTLKTTFTGDDESWEEDALVGLLLNPDTSQPLQFVILANTPNTVTVWGDFADLGAQNDEYAINDYRITVSSSCIDSGDNDALPADLADLDGDGDTDEALPLDLEGHERAADHPGTSDNGNGTPPLVDMGAYEFFSTPPCPCGDINRSGGQINLTDFICFVSCYRQPEPDENCPLDMWRCSDLDRDSDVDLADFHTFALLYGLTPDAFVPECLLD